MEKQNESNINKNYIPFYRTFIRRELHENMQKIQLCVFLVNFALRTKKIMRCITSNFEYKNILYRFANMMAKDE